MLFQDTPPIHLTYCLNIHPGESWPENFAAIRDKAVAVRDLVAPGKRFGLGLRLSHQAAQQLADQAAMSEFRRFLDERDLYVFTINGFPYGAFHGKPIKQEVYRPDWQSSERRDYTNLLADILAVLLPDGITGSISTVPCSYKEWITDHSQVHRMVQMLCECAVHLDEIRNKTGKLISLGLEPEPDCFIEDTRETIAFFDGPLAQYGTTCVQQHTGKTRDEAHGLLRRHLGVCFDTCHLAVQFEDLAASLDQLIRSSILISKVQLSSALRAEPTEAVRKRLREFCDPVYLHQVKLRPPDHSLCSYPDLPEALDACQQAIEPCEARIHFHVPLFFTGLDDLKTTGTSLTSEFAAALKRGATQHLEIETYTFGVLPPSLRAIDVTHSIAREYDWVLRKLLA